MTTPASVNGKKYKKQLQISWTGKLAELINAIMLIGICSYILYEATFANDVHGYLIGRINQQIKYLSLLI